MIDGRPGEEMSAANEWGEGGRRSKSKESSTSAWRRQAKAWLTSEKNGMASAVLDRR